MHLLITRPEPDASEMRQALLSEGHTADVSPLLEIELLVPPQDAFEGIGGLVITSRNGLRALAASPALPRLTALPVFVVGTGTARAARALGFSSVTLGPAAAKDLLPVILAVWPTLAPAGAPAGRGGAPRLLHVSGDKLSFDLAPPLAARGITLERRIVYRSHVADALTPAALEGIRRRRYDAVVLMSPATAEAYLHIVEVNGLLADAVHPIYLCLSRGIARCLEPLRGARIKVAARPNIEETVALVRELAAEFE